MLKNNIKKSIVFAYDNVSFVDGKWYAWYKDTLRTEDIPTEDS